MFDIPAPKPTDELSAIIIDQQTLVKDALKSVLFQIGVNNVRAVSGASRALAEFKKQSFELVFIAFDLNTDKDGFHLLEELKLNGHVSKSTTVIFLSADTDPALVHSVVELQPDDFWTKPVDASRVKQRLVSILETRRALYKPFYCADKQAYSRAIYYAERYIKESRFQAYYPKLQRLIGDSLCKMGEFSDAETFYHQLLEQVDYGWVHIGYVYCLLKQHKADEAEQHIGLLKTRKDTRFTVYDMLANYFVEEGQFERAYEEIKHANQLAPRNIERNKRSWDLARLNHDEQGQYNATLQMAKYAKNSIHDSPDLTLNVIRAGIDLATVGSGDAALPLLYKVEKQVNDLRGRYGREFDLKLSIAEARMLAIRGDKQRADRLLRSLNIRQMDASLEDNMDVVKLLHSLGHREDAVSLLRDTQQLVTGDSFSSHILSHYLEREIKDREEIHFTPKELLEMASTHYKKKRFLSAYKTLDNAFHLSPQNPNIAINILKVLVDLSQTSTIEEDQIKVQTRCFNLLETLNIAAEQKKRIEKYKALLTTEAL